MPDTTELLAGLREALNLWDDTGKAYEFLRKRRADIEAAVRDAEVYRKFLASVDAEQLVRASEKYGDALGVLRDAARYRYLRDADPDTRWNDAADAVLGCGTPEQVDATIDAAMAAQHSAREG